jgi:hypothetical protein
MGGGSWDSKLYSSSANSRKIQGMNDFQYSKDQLSKPSGQRAIHPDLDPTKIKDSINHLRESRDSTEHPDSLAIKVDFDVTGSMSTVPQIYQKNLGKLMSFLIMKGGIEHPQIQIGAIGDTNSDEFPYQVGQFESDNKIDEQLRKIILEGGGGGQVHESYALTFFMASQLISIDCFEKRGKKGYLFISGDEMPYEKLTRNEINRIFALNEEKDYSMQELVDMASEKYEIYFILPSMTSYYNDPRITNAWKKYLGERVLKLDQPAAICELIASIIALNEGCNQNDVVKGLKYAGANDESIKSASKALTTFSSGLSVKGNARSSSDMPKSDGEDSIQRL